MSYINPFSSYFNPDYGKMISLAFGMTIVIAFNYSKDAIDHKLLNVSIGIYFIYSCLILLNPELFVGIQNLFIRNTNSGVELGYRGISTFSTEPGLFGGLLIFSY